MRHLAAFLAIGSGIAFAGCAGTPGFDPSLSTAGQQAAVAIFQKIKDDPSLPFCVANAANRVARVALGGRAQGANRSAGAVTRKACLALGGKPAAAPPVNAVPATQVAPGAAASAL